jgi:hypothetical protein
VRRGLTALAVLAVLALIATPAGAGNRSHHKHKPAGVKGVVLDGTCPGACAEPPPPEPLYTGAVTVTVSRASDGAEVASRPVGDGHFRMRVKRGTYDVTAIPPSPTCGPLPEPQKICPPPCEPTPTTVCPLPADGAAIVAPCITGETRRVKVRRHRFTRVELHVRNVCIA